jgi:hypothetical protein
MFSLFETRSAAKFFKCWLMLAWLEARRIRVYPRVSACSAHPTRQIIYHYRSRWLSCHIPPDPVAAVGSGWLSLQFDVLQNADKMMTGGGISSVVYVNFSGVSLLIVSTCIAFSHGAALY